MTGNDPVILSDPLRRGVAVAARRPRGIRGRIKGLIGAPAPRPGSGLLIRTKQVHTWGLGYPIDAVYLSRSGVILKVANLRPRRLGPLVLRARWVLEMTSGEADRLDLRRGGTLRMEGGRS